MQRLKKEILHEFEVEEKLQQKRLSHARELEKQREIEQEYIYEEEKKQRKRKFLVYSFLGLTVMILLVLFLRSYSIDMTQKKQAMTQKRQAILEKLGVNSIYVIDSSFLYTKDTTVIYLPIKNSTEIKKDALVYWCKLGGKIISPCKSNYIDEYTKIKTLDGYKGRDEQWHMYYCLDSSKKNLSNWCEGTGTYNYVKIKLPTGQIGYIHKDDLITAKQLKHILN